MIVLRPLSHQLYGLPSHVTKFGLCPLDFPDLFLPSLSLLTVRPSFVSFPSVLAFPSLPFCFPSFLSFRSHCRRLCICLSFSHHRRLSLSSMSRRRQALSSRVSPSSSGRRRRRCRRFVDSELDFMCTSDTSPFYLIVLIKGILP